MVFQISRNKILLFIIFLSISGFFIFIRNIFAQEEAVFDKKAITLSPLIFDLRANPGERLKNQLRVYNSGKKTVLVKMLVETFTPVGETGSVQIIDFDEESGESYSLKNWVEIESNVFELAPRQEKIVNFAINLPENAEPGGHYGSLVATIGMGDDLLNSGGGSQITQKIASLILLAINGEVKEKLIINNFSGPNFQEYGPVTLNLKLENQGTVHLRPKGFITIANWQNKKIIELPIPQSAVLPGAKRTINIVWNERNVLGKFTATLVGFYGLNNTPIKATWVFWVWPWKITLVVLIIIILLLIFSIRARKRIGAALRILFKGKTKI